MNESRDLAPIALFVYKRPSHTKRTLESLSRNKLCEFSDVIIFADGRRENETPESLLLLKEVLEICKSFKNSKSVKIVERQRNFGLADNIIGGINKIFETHDRVIVLEDDLELSPYFLDFMNNSLELYKNEEKIFHVSGYWFPTRNSSKLPETFFLNMATCWGWGTWKRAWNHFNPHVEELKSKIQAIDPDFSTFNYNGYASFKYQLDANIQGNLKTWAIRWYATIFVNDALSLHPRCSFVNNIGNDSSGENCDTSDIYTWASLSQRIDAPKINPILSLEARSEMLRFLKDNSIERKEGRLRKILKVIISPSIRKKIKTHFFKFKEWKERRKFAYLCHRKRFEKGELKLLGKRLRYLDGPSFYFMYQEIFLKEIYKLKNCQEKPLFIDGGANIGLATIYLKELFPNSRIIAFEPDPRVFDILRYNIEKSFKFRDVSLVPKGLWDSEKELNFFSEGTDGGRIQKHIDRQNVISVSTIKLSDFIIERVDFLKLDIEGAEFTVLREIQNKLSLIDRIFIEYHSFIGEEQNLAELLSILKQAGFRLNINSPGLISSSPFEHITNYNGMDMQLNIFAMK